jgi:uncharacterized membrane protein
MPLEKRIVLAVVAVAVLLTFLVEVVVIRGDISRMNTVFKFYMQVWEMFSVASGAAFIWLLADLSAWSAGWRRLWSAAAAALILGAALYPVTAAQAKIRDRWETSAPHTLDGMAFMQNVTYYDVGGSTNLGEDYRAIQWMQDHIQGSPVIVEANTPEYRWGSRFTIYTGLPGVLGWDWHQRQQRGVAGDQVVTQRALDILGFYLTRSVDDADAFLDRYHVDYVVVGELERMFYASVQPCQPINGGQAVACSLSGYPLGMTNPDVTAAECTPVNGQTGSADLVCPTHGLDKFATMEAQGVLRAVYRDGGTVIYEVVR